MKDFDDIFSRKAKEAFENYNADHLADEGWNAWVTKHGRQKKRPMIIPLWARAAVITVLVTTGVLFTARLLNNRDRGTVTRVAREDGTERTESVIKAADTSAVTLEIAAAMAVTPESTHVAASHRISTGVTVSEPENHLQEVSKEAIPQVSSTNDPIAAEASRPDVSVSSETVIAEGIPAGVTDGRSADVSAGVTDGRSADVSAGITDERSADVSAGITDAITAGRSLAVNLITDPAEKRLTDAADARLSLQPKKALSDWLVLPRERMTTTIMTGFSGMMASIGNTTSSARGLSIGFYLEQQLTHRISVRPGLAMARHAYSMESASPGSASLDYAAPELNGMSGTTSSYEADIEVLSMEVPVNFVFSVRKRARTNLFVTTGASTVFYLNQRLTGSFNNTYTKTFYNASTGLMSYESMTTTARVESEHEFLNHVDFMGLANFSAGYSFPFSKTSNLLFEPFVQLPVKDLTSLNLRIRYGGISMKIQF
jgi:hypothetical protein